MPSMYIDTFHIRNYIEVLNYLHFIRCFPRHPFLTAAINSSHNPVSSPLGVARGRCFDEESRSCESPNRAHCAVILLHPHSTPSTQVSKSTILYTATASPHHWVREGRGGTLREREITSIPDVFAGARDVRFSWLLILYRWRREGGGRGEEQ